MDLPIDLGTSTLVLEDWENWLFGDAVGGVEAASYSSVHPGLIQVLTMRGPAVPITDMLELVGARLEDGPMVASQQTELLRPLRVGATYTVHSSVTEIVAKQGRRSGAFDLVTYLVTLSDEAGIVASLASRIAMPKASS